MTRRLLWLLLGASSVAHAATPLPVDCPGWRGPRITQQQAAQARRELETAMANPGPGNLALADALTRMADAYFDGYQRPTASDLGRRAYAIWSAAAPSSELAEKLGKAGAAEIAVGRCEMAQPALRASFEMLEDLYGADDPRTLAALHEMVQVSVRVGDGAAVDELAPRLLAAWDRHGVPAGIDRPALHLRLALLYDRLGQFPKAEAVARRGRELAMARPSPDARQVRELGAVLASALYGQLRLDEGDAAAPDDARHSARWKTEEELIAMTRAGDLAGALVRAEQALAAEQAALERARAGLAAAKGGTPVRLASAGLEVDSGTASVAKLLDWVGELHLAMGHPAQAQQAYLQALSLLASDAAADPLMVARTKSDLAILYRRGGEHARALPLQQEALKTMLPLLGAAHPDVLESQAEVARIQAALAPH